MGNKKYIGLHNVLECYDFVKPFATTQLHHKQVGNTQMKTYNLPANRQSVTGFSN